MKGSYKQKAFIYIQASLLAQVCKRNPPHNTHFKTEERKAIPPMNLKCAVVSAEEGSGSKLL